MFQPSPRPDPLRRLMLVRLLAAPFAATLSPMSHAKGGALDTALSAAQADPAWPVPALSALVVRAGRVAYEGHFGSRRLDAALPGGRLPADANTLYRVASISKLVTAVAVMRLVEQGRLRLDDDIGHVLGWPVRHPRHPDVPITLRMLMSHTSSLTDRAGTGFAPSQSLQTVLADDGPQGPWADDRRPGTYFQYCNLAWGLIGTVMEAASGERFDRCMHRLVLQPLGMAGGFEPAEFSADEIAHTAVLYRKQNAAGQWDANAPWVPQVDDFKGVVPPLPEGIGAYRLGHNATPFGPQGRLHTRVGDLGRLMCTLIHGGAFGGVRLLKRETLQAMQQLQWQRQADGSNGDDLAGLFNAWGLGMQQITDRSEPGRGDRLLRSGGWRPWGHFGFAYGLQAGFFFDSARRCGFVYALSGEPADGEAHHTAFNTLSPWEGRVAELLSQHALARAAAAS